MTPRTAFRLSVIVCAHNEARFLPACLHSLLAQTRVPDEIVVVNNASTDETRAVAQQIPYVHVWTSRAKGSWSRARRDAVPQPATSWSTSMRTAARRYMARAGRAAVPESAGAHRAVGPVSLLRLGLVGTARPAGSTSSRSPTIF